MLRHDMWKGDVPENMIVPKEIVEMKPGPLTKAFRAEKKARRRRKSHTKNKAN